MKKIIFIEGLPNVGKTYLIKKIESMNLKDVHIVDELINPDINNPFTDSEYIFLKNDELKLKKYNEGIIIIDRGPISTLVYNQVKHVIDNNYDASYVEEWFKKFIDIYKSNNTYTYFLNTPNSYKPSLYDSTNPFGSIDNLKITKELTIYNLKKYAKNYKIIEYYKESLMEVINEIIN